MSNTDNYIEKNVDGAASEARDAFGKAARQVKKLNSSLMNGAKDGTDKMTTLLEKQGRAAFSNLQTVVTERPTVSVGVALGAGLILGVMLSARRTT